jgi:hypothetical protein
MCKPIRNNAVPLADLLCVCNGREAIEQRLREVDVPKVAPLNDWVRSLRERGVPSHAAAATIPWFDPRSAGTAAKVLLLLQDPSETATSTRFISPDNNDPTASCTTRACNEAGLDRGIRLHWNVYPWWVNVPGGSKKKGGAAPDPTRPPERWDDARKVAAKLTSELFGLLADLRVVVVLGAEANRAFAKVLEAGLRLPDHVMPLLDKPSLSPPGVYSKWSEAVHALTEAREHALAS